MIDEKDQLQLEKQLKESLLCFLQPKVCHSHVIVNVQKVNM